MNERDPRGKTPETWNTHCPKSGRPVIEDAYFDHEGIRVRFCNPQCAIDGAMDPEYWIKQAYPDRD